MADGTAVTALEGREAWLDKGPRLDLVAFAEDSPRASEKPRLGRRNDRAILPVALLSSLAVHAGALAGVLVLSAQFAPVPLPVAGLVSIGVVASEGSPGAAVPSVEDVSPGVEALQQSPSAETVSPAVPQAALAPTETVTAPPIETLASPAREIAVKPANLLESLVEADAETAFPVLPEIEPASGAPSPQALLLDSTEPKRLPDVSPAATVAKAVSARTPPMPSRKPPPPQLAQAADKAPAEDRSQLAATPGHGQRQAGKSAEANGRPTTEGGAATGSSGSGGAGSGPRFAGQGLSNPPPRYPHLARQKGQEGRVIIRVRVGTDGDAKSVTVRESSGYPLLDNAAAKAIRGWRFVPASLAGVAMAGTVDVPVTFRLTEQ